MAGLTEFGRLRMAGIKTQMPRRRMEARIRVFLKSVNVCVMATSHEDQPLATPIEYYSSKDFTVYIAAAATTKVSNLIANPRISIGIYSPCYADWTKWYEVKGAQIFGTAELVSTVEQPEAYAEAMRVYKWRNYRRAMGLPAGQLPRTTVIKVAAQTIAYRDLSLLREGFAAVQVWKREG